MSRRRRTASIPAPEVDDVMYGYGLGMNGWAYALMAAGNLLFWGLLAVGVLLLVRHLSGDRRGTAPSPAPQTPEQVLAGRFARGEIDEDEYRRRLTALSGGRAGQGRSPTA